MARSTKYRSTPQSDGSRREFNDAGTDAGTGQDPKALGCAYLAIVFGPSASSAKSRVIFAVDGLEVKVWGQRDNAEDLGGGSADESEDSEEGDDGGDSEGGSSDQLSDSGSESDSDLESASGSSTDSIIDDSSPSPPLSRSPSPASSSSSSRSRSPEQEPEPKPPGPQPCPAPTRSPQILPENQIESETAIASSSYASEQQAFRTAERLLSRTLATACAEEDGHGIASELGIDPVFAAFFIFLADALMFCNQLQLRLTSSSVHHGGSRIPLGRLNRIWE